MSQTTKILNHLKRKPLTPIEALRKYGCFRLSGRIFDLRSEGFNIETEMIKKGDKIFAKYSLKN